MKLRQALTLAVLALTGALFSCGSSTATTHLLYVSTGQGIYAYRVNNSGSSSSIPSAPFYIGNTPAGIVVDASGDHAYVANQADNTISLLTIDHASGVLTEVLPRTSVGGFSPNQIALDPGGTALFVGNQLSNNIAALSIGKNGTLTPPGSSQLVQLPSPPANLVAANGLLFVAAPSFSQVYVFSINSGNLTAVSGSPISVANGVGSVTVDGSAKYLYVTNPSADTVSGFTIQYSSSGNSIALPPIPGSPFTASVAGGTTPARPISAVLDSTVAHLYVANYGTSNVSLFSVASDGALAPMSSPTVQAGTNPSQLLIDPIGNFLLVGNIGAKTVTVLPIKSDGTFSSGQTVNLGAVPQAFAVTR